MNAESSTSPTNINQSDDQPVHLGVCTTGLTAQVARLVWHNHLQTGEL